MLGENEEQHYLPPGVHFENKLGEFAFRDAVRKYLADFTCRVCANVLCPHGGGAAILSITEMPRKKQRELLEVVLMTESDAALKAMIEDSLADDMDLQELAGILEEAECICSEGDI